MSRLRYSIDEIYHLGLAVEGRWVAGDALMHHTDEQIADVIRAELWFSPELDEGKFEMHMDRRTTVRVKPSSPGALDGTFIMMTSILHKVSS